MQQSCKILIFITKYKDVNLPFTFVSSKKKAEIENEQKALQSQLAQIRVQTQLANVQTQLAQQNNVVYPAWDINKQVNRYSNTDDIYSIINLISTASASIPLYCYEKGPDGELVDLPENDKFYQLMESPHMTLSKYEFTEAIHKLLPIQGEVILWKVRLDSGVNAGLPYKLEFLETQHIKKNVGGAPFFNIRSYTYAPNGIPIDGMENIPPEDIIHIRYFQTLSPLQALKKRLISGDVNLDVTVSQMQNGGTPSIIYQKDSTDASDIAGQHKDNFYKFATNTGNTGLPYWAGDGELGLIQVGLKLADMQVAELGKINFKKLCNGFSVSDRLFNNDATGSEISDDNARKGLYTNACMPNIIRIRDAFNNQLAPDFNKVDKKKRIMKEDLSEIKELQADSLKQAQTVSTLPIFIPNEMRVMFGYDKLLDPNADEVYVKNGYSLLKDLQGAGDLPLTEDYDKE